MSELFPDLPAFPGEAQGGDGRAITRHDNQPPLEERVVMDFEDKLKAAKLDARVAQLSDSAGRAPACDNDDAAGKIGELLSLARAARKAVEDLREGENRPILNAQRALKAKADALLAPMDTAMNALKRSLDAYMSEQARKAAEARRKAEEDARRLQEEARANAAPDEPIPVVTPAPVPAPSIRSDLGTLVSARKVWRFEREVPIAKLPKDVLENQTVVDAVDKVLGAMVRGGARKIKGVRIFEDAAANIR
jgi:hypothetical protein